MGRNQRKQGMLACRKVMVLEKKGEPGRKDWFPEGENRPGFLYLSVKVHSLGTSQAVEAGSVTQCSLFIHSVNLACACSLTDLVLSIW